VIRDLHSKYEEFAKYRKTTLQNGIRIVTEEIPYLQSVSLGIWVHSGSRFENPAVNGICHFIEHMVFKGTERRSTLDIAKEIDAVGGALNAFTSKEMTCFHCRVLNENLELAVDLLTDIFLNPSFPEDEIEREKQVICQEIHQLEDSPEDYIHEELAIRFWQDDPLGQPIMGSIPIISSLDRDTLVNFKRDVYSPSQTIVCASGNLDHDRLVEMIDKTMGRLAANSSQSAATAPKSQGCSVVVPRDLEQVHVCMGTKGPSAKDKARYAVHILNTILGGGWSSRLLQEVREKRGLAYSVYSFVSSFVDTGMFGLYAGCDPARLEELLSTMGGETLNLHSTLSDDDIRTAKTHIKGNLILAMESTDARMNRLAKCEFYFDRYLGLDEIIDAFEAVTKKQLADTAEQMLNLGELALVALGPIPEKTDLSALFNSPPLQAT
jgi:predicted Zn-dependent peptidase